MVALPARTWRPYVGPVAFLLAATVAIGVLRVTLHHSAHAAPPPAKHAARAVRRVHEQQHYYVVHAGDTLSSIAAKQHLALAALRKLNPKVQPTALYLGEKLRLP